MAEDSAIGNAEAGEKQVNKNKKYRRDKPWDHEGIDHWKVCVCHRGAYMCVSVLEESQHLLIGWRE